MSSQIRNLIVFLIIGVVVVVIYMFFFKSEEVEVPNLVSSPVPNLPISNNALNTNTPAGDNFLSVLLNVKNIKLDDSIFRDPAFGSLNDSSIVLVPDGNEGRPNPFAPFTARETPLEEEELIQN